MKVVEGNNRLLKKNLRVGVKSDDGITLLFLDGMPVLPALAKGFVGELILSPGSLINKKLSHQLSRERKVPFLKVGTYLMMGVGTNMLGGFRDGLIAADELRIASLHVCSGEAGCSCLSSRQRRPGGATF